MKDVDLAHWLDGAASRVSLKLLRGGVVWFY